MKSGMLFVWFLAASAWANPPLTSLDESRLFFAGWKMPSVVSVERLEKLLQRATDAIHRGKGFRYVGVEEDWFHGHLLLEAVGEGTERKIYPRAILYHTQEEAYGAHWKGNPDAKFDYVEVTTRNWIQWLDEPSKDGVKVENARAYLDTAQKKPEPFFDEGAAPVEGQHYTIHAKNLDPKKLKFEIYGELQFEFYLSDCNAGPENEYDDKQGPIRLTVPGEREECLKLATMNPLIRHPWGAH